ncbi:MAG: hypothetical protein PF636_09380 [Actinomycetota bacterium]|nr:hypothetical protein [Actinomycetota bacterium]
MDNVVVLDLYSLLADSDGSLSDEFAVSSGDSLLNGDAYDALDAELLALLDDLE